MSSVLPKLYLARHGDTAWTDSHQHTGRTDIPMNERGEVHARQLGERLREKIPLSSIASSEAPTARSWPKSALSATPILLML
jgi:probable phosphoglycerate mutase